MYKNDYMDRQLPKIRKYLGSNAIEFNFNW